MQFTISTPHCSGSARIKCFWFSQPHFINIPGKAHLYSIYWRMDCNFWATFSGNGHEEFHYNLHNLCTTVICIIKICTFRADSGPGRSSLALGSAVSGPGPGPCPGIYLCKHIITNAKSQKPQFKVDLCLTVSPLTLVRLIPQRSEEWQMGKREEGDGVTRTKCTPRSHANQSLAFYCRNPIWHIYKGSVWGLWLANLIIDGCLLRFRIAFCQYAS